MKIRIGNTIIDANKEPIVLMFEDDNERLITGGQITSMQPKEGARAYAMFPSDHPALQDTNYLPDSLKLAGYVG